MAGGWYYADGADGFLKRLGDGEPGPAWDEFAWGEDEAATIAAAGLYRPTTSVVDGDLNITTDNQTFEDVLVRGQIYDRANGTRLKNVRVTMEYGRNENYSPPTQAGIFTLYDTTGKVYEHLDIDPANPTVDTYGIIGNGYTLIHADIKKCVDSLHINDTFVAPVNVWGSYLHDPRWYAVDPRQSDGSHSDLCQLFYGQVNFHGTVFHTGDTPVNARTDGCDSAGYAILVSKGGTQATGFSADRCWFNGRSYSQIKVGEQGRGLVSMSVTNSRFKTDAQNPLIHGSATSVNAGTFTNNTGPDGLALPGSEIWADSGTP